MVAVEFLEIISDLLCADQIQRGKSLLAGKLGHKVAAPLVSLMDDPWMEAGLGSSLYDDEGLPTAPKTMIDSGVLKEYFYDFYTAQKEGRSSNGCASRGSFKGLPSPSSSNFYLKPGSLSYNEIISQSSRGIVLMEVMGMHMADPISGEFSVGASGLAVERGSVTHPVKNAMISGNILDILRGIDGIGSDLTFFGSVGSPTFRVQSLMVA
jgi:PmbA protein